MAEEKPEKLPLDAKLLSDAVMELNISRRSVGLYPPEHPLLRESISRAYGILEKLFEIRHSITLGIAQDTLVIDEYTLEKKNPVYREFAKALHEKGIASATFSSGLSWQELVSFHELIVAREGPLGKAFEEALRQKQVRHIAVSPLDFANFGFAEGMRRDGENSAAVWEEYVYKLLQGHVGRGDSLFLQSVPPEEMARVVNTVTPDKITEEAYDQVITAYMRRKDESRLSRKSLEKLFSFIDRLNPDMKQKFLTRSCTHFSGDIEEVEALIGEMTPEMFERTATLFGQHRSFIPPTLRHVIDKLSAVKNLQSPDVGEETAQAQVLDDIEIGAEVASLFTRDHFHSYVNEDYEKQLGQILKASGAALQQSGIFSSGCTDEKIDDTALEIMLELTEIPWITKDKYLALISRLSELMPLFVETGRFHAVLETYNTLNWHVKTGRFAAEASGIIIYDLSSITFVESILDSFRLWGRKEREAATKLFRALRHSMADPLLDALAEEQDPSIRKFYLTLLASLGPEIGSYLSNRLRDNRWHVLRNMLYLVRECRDERHVDEVRRLLKHDHPAVAMEALRTLIDFRSPDALEHFESFLRSDIEELKRGAIRLAGMYRLTGAVDSLIAMLTRRDILGKEIRWKIEAAKALGEIGDPRAVAAFASIANERSLFSRKVQDELKRAIFRSLGNFPPEAVRALVSSGLTSGDEEIRSTCQLIESKRRREVRKQ